MNELLILSGFCVVMAAGCIVTGVVEHIEKRREQKKAADAWQSINSKDNHSNHSIAQIPKKSKRRTEK